MTMKLERMDLYDITILKVKGALSGELDGDNLMETIRGLLEVGGRKLVIDMGGVAWVNSTGVRELFSCLNTVTNHGGYMKLTSLTPRVRQILKINNFDIVFETHPGVREALASFYRSTQS